MKDNIDVRAFPTIHAAFYDILWAQIPIKAGHEFTVSVDEKYSKSGDDKVLFMDYVCDARVKLQARLFY